MAVSSGDLIADMFNLTNAEGANYAIGYSGEETLTGGLRQDVMTGVQIDLSDWAAAPSSYTRSRLDVPPEPYRRPARGDRLPRAVGQRLVLGKCSSGMDPDANGIFILCRGMLAESGRRAFEAASAIDGRTISMPTTTGKRIAKLRTTLTKRVIDALRPTDKSWIAWDDKLLGFGVRIHPGGAKSLIINYRTGDGGRKAPNKRVVIDRYGKTRPDQARRLARNLLGQVAGGHDPAYERAMVCALTSPGDGADVESPTRERSERETATPLRTKYLNTRQAAEYLGLSTRTINRYRITGDGPSFYRFGGCVRYVCAELNEWAVGRRRTSTSDNDRG